MSHKISVIGSGNWGSVVANIVAQNISKLRQFENSVRMWVFPEMVNGENLVDIINTRHENVKYMPGLKLCENIVADSDLQRCARESDFLVFVLPHQFLGRTLNVMKDHVKKSAIAVSLIKGIFCSKEHIQSISQKIKQELGVPTCSISGANVASEVAKGQFAEATLGYNEDEVSSEKVLTLQKIFSLPTFHVTPINDVVGVEICGALKNIVALAAGFVDGLNYGTNTKSAILRIGMIEIQKFALEFFENVRNESFWQSCGFADLITTCFSGRNRKCAEEFAKTGEDWEAIEKRILGGQKLQGPSASKEIYEFLLARNKLKDYPLFFQIYKVSFGINGVKEKPETIVKYLESEPLPSPVLK